MYDRLPGHLQSMESLGDRTVVLSYTDPSTGDLGTNVTLLGPEGTPEWCYKAKGPAYTLRFDAGEERLTLLEGASSRSRVRAGGVWRLTSDYPTASRFPELKRILPRIWVTTVT